VTTLRRTFVATPAAFLLGGCAAWFAPPQSAALLTNPPTGLPPRVELDALPFFPQTPYHCGPAALATVLRHAGFEQASPESLGEQVFLPAREGSLQIEMLAAARRAGALAVMLPGTLAALCTELAAGQPMVVLQNLGLAIAPRWHYAVPAGYDLAVHELVLRSGTTRRERLDFALFERTWARGGHWAFAALRPGRLPVTANEADAVQAAIGFERAVPSTADRAAVYDSLVARWPRNLAALIGQGHARATLGDWRAAAASFQRAADHHDSAAAWHNLGLTRWQLGERDAARMAAQRALQRAQSSDPAWLDAARKLVEQTRAP
jgi:tetratricopeptide (TPR) repeat protein